MRISTTEIKFLNILYGSNTHTKTLKECLHSQSADTETMAYVMNEQNDIKFIN